MAKAKTKEVKQRGFKVVGKKHRKYPEEKIILPVRKTKYSAGYDFSTPVAITIPPQGKILLFTDVKTYMLDDEVLKIYIRSSLAIKKGLVLQNGTGVIDFDYEANIGLGLLNTSNKTIHIKKGECIAQGIFSKYLISDNDGEIEKEDRNGGFGSTSE